jgi:hypothetical protein
VPIKIEIYSRILQILCLNYSFPVFLLSMIISLSVVNQNLLAQEEVPDESSKIKLGPDKRVRVYTLDELEVRGTTRISGEHLALELGLVKGIPLNDDLVMNTHGRLMGLGLFKSAILFMKKGEEPGTADLVIEVEDDEQVLTDWAIGGELGVTMTDTHASAIDPDTAPMDYRFRLVGRNIFQRMHRSVLFADIDNRGELRQGQVAYGLPRFAQEDVQFDTELAVSDVFRRYLHTRGFGSRVQGLWSKSSEWGEIQYGAAMYANTIKKFKVPGFPKVVAGPKIALYDETRLKSFFPESGHLMGVSLLLDPISTSNSVVELDLAKTIDYQRKVFFTIESHLLSVGSKGHSLRGEARLDLPLGDQNPGEDLAEVFLRFGGGQDKIGKTHLLGSAAVVGVRYHSSGFIAEFSIKVTRSPSELINTNLRPVSEGGSN